ncbi:MAG: nitroreductase [Paracoccaceae bacterium]|jgi:nitroreductase
MASETQAIDTLNALLEERYSCRGFLAREVPKATIVSIIETAQKIPSWCNAQPWQLDICSGDAADKMRGVLTEAASNHSHTPDFTFPDTYENEYKDRRRACGFQLYDAVGIKKGDRAASANQMMLNFRFFDAPHVAFVTTQAELGTYGAVDCGAFVTAFTLAAEALGVQSIPQAAVASYPTQIREALGLPQDRLVVCAISFGYEDPVHPANGFRTDRASVKDVARFHTS